MSGAFCIPARREGKKNLSKSTASLKPQDRLESITLFVSAIYDSKEPGIKKSKFKAPKIF